MKKVLFVASVALHINSFHLPFLKWFKENGYTVDVATAKEMEIDCCDNHFKVDFARNPLKPQNFKAYKQIKKLIRDNDYDIIHCHTPTASILTRLAARKVRKKGTKVIYTAHGFHFFKGAPLLNWLIYYPIEKLCSKWTDVLITINKEDFTLAQKKMKAKRIEYVPGVGVDLEKFKPDILTYEERKELRASLGVSEDDKLLFSVGELNDNKNHVVILRAMAKLPDSVKYCIAGQGNNKQKLLDLAEKLGVKDRFCLLGQRKDIPELLNCTDVFCFPSLREGLPVSLMEAVACGVPVVCSKVRGNTDLVENMRNGILAENNDAYGFGKAIASVLDSGSKYNFFENNLKDIEKFSSLKVAEKMKMVYSL